MPSWEDLVREHHALVAGVAARVLGDRAAAEDVAQDVFLHLLQNPRALDGASNVRSFLCRAAVNRALDRIRERGRRERREAAVPAAPREPDPLEAAWREEIRRTVEALPEGERDAIAARFFRGLTVREAAAEMRVSVGTVCNRLEAGLKRLRKWLGAAAFALLLGVMDGDALAIEAPGAKETLLRRKTPRPARRAGKSIAAAAGLVAAVLFSLWLGRPGETPSATRRPVEIAKETGDVAPPGRLDPGESPGAEPAARPPSRPLGAAFRAEGFLVRDGESLTLAEPLLRDPLRIAFREPPIAAGAARTDAYEVRSLAPEHPFRFAPGPLTSGLPVAAGASFDLWLYGGLETRAVPHVRLAVRAAWLDQATGEAALLGIEDVERLSDAWLLAWRDAWRANRDLDGAFRLPPGPLRRAEAMAALDRFEDALGRARGARRGDASATWRVRRESELEIASAGASVALGLEEELPEEPDAGALAAAQAAGLELEAVPVLQRAALALRGGARIASVAPGSAAERAGLRAGDLVWRAAPSRFVAPQDVRRPEDLAALLADSAEGAGIQLGVVRGLEALDVTLDMRR